MSEQYAQTAEVIKEELGRIHPKHIVNIAIPGNRSSKIRTKLLSNNFMLRAVQSNGIKISLPERPVRGHIIIESIQITDNGLVFIDVIGDNPSPYSAEVIKAIVARMRDCGMKDFFAATSEEATKTRCLVYAFDGHNLNLMFTLMGVANLRVVNDRFAVHTSVGAEENINEIRTMSLKAIKRGKYLPSDFICETTKDVAFLGRPNLGAFHPYIPATFKDRTSQRLSLEALFGKRRNAFLEDSDVQGGTVFMKGVAKVIGKIGPNLYGAVQDESLVLMPKKLA